MKKIYWDNRIDRIRCSGCFDLANNTYIGDHYVCGKPYLVPNDRRNRHIHVMGGSRGGKSAFVAGYVAQAIADGASVLMMPLKDDPLQMESVKIECAHEGVLFRCVDIRPGHRTHLFPFRQPFLKSQSAMAHAEMLIQAFGLDGGFDKDAAFYSAMDEKLQYGSLVLRPEDVTPNEIARHYEQPSDFRRVLLESEWKHTSMSRSVVTKLTSVTAMNATAGSPGVTPKVLEYAIDLRQLFIMPQVVYFSLNLRGQRTTSRALAGYAAFLLMMAGEVAPRSGRVERVVLVIDDCQEVICGPHISAMIDSAASLGIELVLLHQDLSQLCGPRDLSTSLAESTGLQIIFAPTAKETRKLISDTSGTKVEHKVSWQQTAGPWFDPSQEDALHPKYAKSGLFDPPVVNVTPQSSPIWTEDAIMRLSAIPNVAWVRLKFDEGLARYQGEWTPVFVPYHITEEEKRIRERFPQPDAIDETIPVEVVSDFDRQFEDRPKPTPPTSKKPTGSSFKEERERRKREEEERKKRRR